MTQRQWGKIADAPVLKFLESLSGLCTKMLELRATQQGLQGVMHLKSLKYSEQKRLERVRAHMANTES